MSIDLGNVVQLTQFFIARICGSLVHIRVGGFEEKHSLCFYIPYIFNIMEVLGLEVPTNGM
jgi:hypothetical protein